MATPSTHAFPASLPATVFGLLAHLPEDAQHRARMHALLAHIDLLEAPVLPTCDEEYRALTRLRRDLSSLSCYTSNSSHPLNDRVWALEGVYGKLQAQYNRKFEIRDADDRSLARYMLYGKFLTAPKRATCFLEARDRGLLVKVSAAPGTDAYPGTLLVQGLNCKVGDNVFTVSRGGSGAEHRQYRNHIGRQAICIEQRIPFDAAQYAQFLSTVPEMTDLHNEVSVGDGKGMVRPIAMRQTELSNVLSLLQASPHESNPVLVPVVPAGAQVPPSPDTPPAPEPEQTDLFGIAA